MNWYRKAYLNVVKLLEWDIVDKLGGRMEMRSCNWRKGIFFMALLLFVGMSASKVNAASVIEIPTQSEQNTITILNPIEIVVPPTQSTPEATPAPAPKQETQTPVKQSSSSKKTSKAEETKSESTKKDSSKKDSTKIASEDQNAADEKNSAESKKETLTESETEPIEETPEVVESGQQEEEEISLEPDTTQDALLQEMNQADTYHQEPEESYWLPPEEEEPVMETVEETRSIGELFQYGGIGFISELSQNGITFMVPALLLLLTVLFGIVFLVMNSNAKRAEEWE